MRLSGCENKRTNPPHLLEDKMKQNRSLKGYVIKQNRSFLAALILILWLRASSLGWIRLCMCLHPWLLLF